MRRKANDLRNVMGIAVTHSGAFRDCEWPVDHGWKYFRLGDFSVRGGKDVGSRFSIPIPWGVASGIIGLGKNSRQNIDVKELRCQIIGSKGLSGRCVGLSQTVTASTSITQIFCGGKVGCHIVSEEKGLLGGCRYRDKLCLW